MGLGNNKVDFLADPARLTKWPDLTDAQRKLYTDAVGLHAHPEHQTQISNLIHEVHAMLPGLFSPRRRAFESSPIHGLVTGRPKQWAEHYIILVNMTGEEVEADITIPESHFRTALPRLFVPRVPAFGKVGKQKLDRNGHLLFGAPWEKLAGPGRIKRRFKPWETVVYGW
ncbi:MAG: hypothetical protein SPK06_00765 [Kiritimatiellia bacterium]|nr:hypothetical protein [Kiritimatiellia bacterium]